MNQFLKFLFVAIFSIFIGAQITEGALFVPYWQSLSPTDFNTYYKEFGPSIGKFYTVLTIIAAIIPILLTIYSRRKKYKATRYALVSSIFAILFVACFFLYFHGVNQLFYKVIFTPEDLQNELVRWRNWHWGRVVLEVISLVFLILGLGGVGKDKG